MRTLGLALVSLAASGNARADRWSEQAESGAEWDSNVHRVEGTATPVPAGLGRAGGRIDGAGDTWALGVETLVRGVLTGERGEDVAVGGLDLRWQPKLHDRDARLGVRASGYDVFDLDGTGVARAFALGGADAVLTLGGEHGERIVTTVGARDFVYKPDRDFDWHGLAFSVRYERSWSSLELAVDYGLERRDYRGVAFTSGCAPGEMVTPACFVPTSLARADLHHLADLELTYTGSDVIVGGAYQVTVNDSSSYGQSLVRHRVTGSVTAELPGHVFATAIATLQLDQHLDPLLVARDVQDQTFTSIDEENRSAASLRLSRRLHGGWAAEARAAYYTDAVSADALRFRRADLYGGLTWNRAP